MTDNEIIKALECCSRNTENDCDDCPFFDDGGCTTTQCMCGLMELALSLINRQQAEIERLNGCVKSEEEVRAIMKAQMIPMVNEIVDEQFDVVAKLARAEAIKEFAERFKELCGNDTSSAIVWAKGTIDNLVKEMVGDA